MPGGVEKPTAISLIGPKAGAQISGPQTRNCESVREREREKYYPLLVRKANLGSVTFPRIGGRACNECT